MIDISTASLPIAVKNAVTCTGFCDMNIYRFSYCTLFQMMIHQYHHSYAIRKRVA